MSTIRKRNRVSVVCTFCKKRKVKCDKGLPCSTCVKYGNRECNYDGGTTDAIKGVREGKKRVKEVGGGGLKSELEELKDKIRNLERVLTNGKDAEVGTRQTPEIDTSLAPGAPETYRQPPQPPPQQQPQQLPQPPQTQTQLFQGKPLFEPGNVDLTSIMGHNPIASSEDSINLHEGYSAVFDDEPRSRRIHGPLSWFSLVKVDMATSLVHRHLHKSLGEFKKHWFNVDVGTKFDGTELEFRKKASTSDGQDDMKLYDEKKPTSLFTTKGIILSSEARSRINEKAKALGHIFYDGKINEELALIEKIKLVLPTKAVIWKHVDFFFATLYIMFPFVDEETFRSQLVELLGEETKENVKVTSLKVTKRLDFAILGLLLILLRLSYLSLFSSITSMSENLELSDNDPKAQELEILMNNPVNIDVIDVSRLCLSQFDLLRRTNMALMQLALFTRMYHMYAPEDGDNVDGGNAQVMMGMLIRMAVSMGLHRDPDYFPDHFHDEKENNLGRKIWYFLLICDLQNSMSCGYPLNITGDYFDTKIPYFTPLNANIRDKELERALLPCFETFKFTYEPHSKLIQTLVKVRGRVKMTDLITYLNFMETYFVKQQQNLKKFGSEETLSQVELVRKTILTKMYVTAVFFMVGILFHIFNYYENCGNYKLSFYYIKKIIVITVLDLMPLYFRMLKRRKVSFENFSDLISTPGFQLAIHKSIIVLHSLTVRLRFNIKYYERLPNHFQKMMDPAYRELNLSLIQLSDLLLQCVRVFIEIVSKLSSRYYYAWKITKAQAFVFDLISGDTFYDTYVDSPLNCECKYSASSLNELSSLIQNTLQKVQTMKMEKKKAERAKRSHEMSSSTGSLSNSNDIASVTSDNSSDRFAANDQIDDIWLQMMALKKDLSMFKQQSDLVLPDGYMAGSPLDLNGSFTPINTNMDVLESILLEEIFKDFA